MSEVLYNAYNPICTLDQCLQQVVGQLGFNPAKQFAACTSLFGAPVVSTSTLPIEITTSMTTVSYTDITISPSTTYSTYESTLTSYANILEVATDYTTTLLQTLTTTVIPTQPLKRDRKKVRRRRCKASSSKSSATPAATNCPSLQEFSSACACINAVSTTSVVTEPGATSTVYETVSTVIPSTIVSAVTVAVTTVIVKPATSTITSTLETAAIATTTATTTGAAPTETGKLVIQGGPHDGAYVQWVSGAGLLSFTTNPDLATELAVVLTGGIPWVASQPITKMYLYSTSTQYSPLAIFPSNQVSGVVPTVTCSVSSSTGYLNCVSAVTGFKYMYQCGVYVYMAPPNLVFSTCVGINLKFIY